MSIAYNTLFARLGKIIQQTNTFLTLQGTTLMGASNGADLVLSQYEARRDLAVNIEQAYEGFASSAAGWIGTLKGLADTTLEDLQTELNAPNASTNTILPMLAAQMAVDAQSVKACTVSTPTQTANAGNLGNGVLLITKKTAAGVDNQNIITETVALTCTSDQWNGARAGGEPFSVVGWPVNQVTSYLPRGNGTGQTLTVADGSNKITNGNFEAFATAPTGWSIVSGSAGATILQEGTLVHTGASALRLQTDGATDTITLNQPLTSIQTDSLYAANVWLANSGTVTAGSNLQVAIKGTGLSDANLYNADPHTLGTNYAAFPIWFASGRTLPNDLRVEIAWTGANTAGTNGAVLLDDLTLVAPVEFGGVSYALFRGSNDFVAGDGFVVHTFNNYGGVIQTWFSRFYGQTLPSVTNGAETLVDGLAT